MPSLHARGTHRYTAFARAHAAGAAALPDWYSFTAWVWTGVGQLDGLMGHVTATTLPRPSPPQLPPRMTVCIASLPALGSLPFMPFLPFTDTYYLPCLPCTRRRS